MGVRVRIFNKEYNLKADEEDEEYLRMVAAYVDDKIRKIATSTSGDVEQISVLACLNIADELYKLRERNRRAKEKIQKLIERIDKETK